MIPLQEPSLPAKEYLKKELLVFHSVCLSLRIMAVSTEQKNSINSPPHIHHIEIMITFIA
jgi:hypothetical protein